MLRRYGDLAREFGDGRGDVVLLAAEKGGELLREENRHYIRIGCSAKDKQLSFGIVDDPFEL